MKAKCPGAIPEIFIATVEGIEFEKEIHWSVCTPSRIAVISITKTNHQFAKRHDRYGKPIIEHCFPRWLYHVRDYPWRL